METQFQTVQDVIDYLKIKKTEQDELQKSNPDYNISLKPISNLSVDLIFDLYDFMHGDSASPSHYSRVSKSGDILTLSGYSSRLPMSCSFQSLKVKENREPVPQRSMYEVIPQ